MMSARRSGIVKSTPSTPPKPAMSVVSTTENRLHVPKSTSAGRGNGCGHRHAGEHAEVGVRTGEDDREEASEDQDSRRQLGE